MLPWRLLREEECNRLGAVFLGCFVFRVLSVSSVRRIYNTRSREPVPRDPPDVL